MSIDMGNRLASQLHAFAAHVRDPQAHPAPEGIEPRRMAVYRRLVRNNLRSLLSANFPVIRKTLPVANWDALVDGFLAGFACDSPLFTRIGEEFQRYLAQREAEDSVDPPWLRELAHYEWVELALRISDATLPAHDPDGDLLARVPLLSPWTWPLAYRWPVHRIGPGFQPDDAGPTPTLLLVRRDASGDVRFSELSPLVFRLLQLLETNEDATGLQLLERLADEAQAQDREAFARDGAAMLHRLRAEGTLLGTTP
jgi:hypothetical protein